ncbi:MAG TPA: hypothetical protein VD948_11385 [Rhodothermales bacterium]|nr:hypothetical protein [Rhodothermales bacterium]
MSTNSPARVSAKEILKYQPPVVAQAASSILISSTVPLGELWTQPAVIEEEIRRLLRRGTSFRRALLSAGVKFKLNRDERKRVEYRMTPYWARRQHGLDIIT